MSSELSFRLTGILWIAGILVGLIAIVTAGAGEQGEEYEPRDLLYTSLPAPGRKRGFKRPESVQEGHFTAESSSKVF